MIRFFLISITLFCTTISCSKKEQNISISSKIISYKLGDNKFTGYLSWDKNLKEKKPGVIVVHEWWGHNEYARKRADMLAKLGYVAFAIDMYGDGKKADHPKDAMRFSQEVGNNFPMAKERFLTAMKVLKENENVDAEKIAAIGYCFGGGVVLNIARSGVDIDGVVSFHGSLDSKLKSETGKVKTKILVLNGADDDFVSKESIDSFKKEMDLAKADYNFINYEGAKHSFTSPMANELGKKFNLPLEYNEKADKESWQKMQDFLNSIF